MTIILSITISVVCTIITVAALCIILLIVHPAKQIEDINGMDNTNLATMEIDEIVTGKHSYVAYNSSDSVKGKRTNVTERFMNCDYDNVYLRSKKISGIRVLQSSNITSDQLVLEINSEVKAGNMEIVITVDGEYYQSVAVNQTCTVTLSGVANKVVLVKMGAESAEMEVTVNRFVG